MSDSEIQQALLASLQALTAEVQQLSIKVDAIAANSSAGKKSKGPAAPDADSFTATSNSKTTSLASKNRWFQHNLGPEVIGADKAFVQLVSKNYLAQIKAANQVFLDNTKAAYEADKVTGKDSASAKGYGTLSEDAKYCKALTGMWRHISETDAWFSKEFLPVVTRDHEEYKAMLRRDHSDRFSAPAGKGSKSAKAVSSAVNGGAGDSAATAALVGL